MPRISTEVSEPAIGGWVVDSNSAFLTGTDTNGQTVFGFAVNDQYDEGEEWLTELWYDREKRQQAARDLAAWSARFAPIPVTAETILAGMPGHGSTEPPTDDIFFGDPEELWILEDDGHGWVFAEDGIRFLYNRLGFDFDKAIWTETSDAPE